MLDSSYEERDEAVGRDGQGPRVGHLSDKEQPLYVAVSLCAEAPDNDIIHAVRLASVQEDRDGLAQNLYGLVEEERKIMEGSMKGSGIDSVEMTREFTCRRCHWEGEADGYSDDWQSTLYAECQNCKEIMEYDLASERDPMFAEHEDDGDWWE